MAPTGAETAFDRAAWRALPGGPSDVGVVAKLADARRPMRGPLVVGVTGGVAAGKSTLGEALGAALRAPVVATDGFLLSNAELHARDLADRKGFPDSFDTLALRTFLRAVRTGDPGATAPVYSHRTYDIVSGERLPIRGDTVVVEGLHLAHDAFGVRQLLDVIVHLDADDADLERWFLERFRELRRLAADDPTAFLHPLESMPDDVVESMALDVWRSVNLLNLVEYARPSAANADIVLHLDADHAVDRAVLRG